MAVNGAGYRVSRLVTDKTRAELARQEGKWGPYSLQMEKEKAAMRKMQKLETGWMRCAGCGGKGKKRCAACFMTTYCSLECHVKDWEEGHRGRCREVRKEFVELVLYPDHENETNTPRPLFTVQAFNLDSEIVIRNRDESVFGDVDRPGQEKAYDKLRKAVEEIGMELDLQEKRHCGTVEDIGSSMTACFLARYMGKTEDGGIKLKINVKQVQPMVMW